MMILHKELIGWTVSGRHYRLCSPVIAIAMRFIDFIGELLLCCLSRRMPADPRSIAVVQLDHVGDMLLAGYFLGNLKAGFPKAKITVIGRSMSREAATLNGNIDEFLSCNVPWLARNDSMGWPAFIALCLKQFRRYDIAFDLHGDPRNLIFTRWIGRFAVGPAFRGMGFLMNLPQWWRSEYSKHIVEMQCAMLSEAGIKLDLAAPALKLPGTYISEAQDILKKAGIEENRFFLIQMSSGRGIKDWPLENWESLLPQLTLSHDVMTLDRDTYKVQRMKQHLTKNIFVAITADFAVYSAIVSLCKHVISVDTFTIHLARLYNKPLTALYSGTNLVSEWGPFKATNNQTVLQDTSCKYFPCYRMFTCPFGYPSPCMKKITVEKLTRIIR